MKNKEYYLTKEIREERYHQLIDLLRDICTTFSVTICKEGERNDNFNNFINNLEKYKISENFDEIQKIMVYNFELNSDSAEIIKHVTDSIYGWLQPYLPENLCFYRNDGSMLLDSLTHHKSILINLLKEEAKILLDKMPGYWLLYEQKPDLDYRKYTKNAVVPDITTDFVSKCKGYYLYDKALGTLDILIDLMKIIVCFNNKKNAPLWPTTFYFVAESDKELEAESHNIKALEAYYYLDPEEKYKILLKEKKKAEKDFLDFIKKHDENTRAYFQYAFNSMIQEYSKVIEIAPYANNYYWEDDYFNLIDLRNDIHYAFEFIYNRKINVNLVNQIDKLRNIDSQLQSECEITSPINSWVETYCIKYPKSHWWWHLHELDKLRKEDLETI